MNDNEIKQAVRERYAKVASTASSCCGAGTSSCCSPTDLATDYSKSIGYSEAEISSVPEGANLGLGCGNPVALASLKEGEVVLDLGSGPGFDCFLAAARVGQSGKVIGVDMTPEMLQKARENKSKGGFENVEFRLGEIENLPVADSSVDVIISNCVINLSPQKGRVFQEAFRVLKPGGRLMVSDIVLLEELPKNIMDSVAAYVGCVAGASKKGDYLDAISRTGFKDVKVVGEISIPEDFSLGEEIIKSMINDFGVDKSDLKKLRKSIQSIKVHALKS
ncbi:MAG: arsenite methyltransferase [Dehalococcoidia bacterium]|nr:arsenite methyltransferase [Dehalococcoidia bacterium]